MNLVVSVSVRISSTKLSAPALSFDVERLNTHVIVYQSFWFADSYPWETFIYKCPCHCWTPLLSCCFLLLRDVYTWIGVNQIVISIDGINRVKIVWYIGGFDNLYRSDSILVQRKFSHYLYIGDICTLINIENNAAVNRNTVSKTWVTTF